MPYGEYVEALDVRYVPAQRSMLVRCAEGWVSVMLHDGYEGGRTPRATQQLLEAFPLRQVSTRILGRRTVHFAPFPYFLTAPRMVLTQYPSTDRM